MSNWRRTAVLRRAGAAAVRSYHTIQAIPRELKGSRVTEPKAESPPSSSPKKTLAATLPPPRPRGRSPENTSSLPRESRFSSSSGDYMKTGGRGNAIDAVEALSFCVKINTFEEGGHLNRTRTTLKYLCPAEHIPPKIEIDISNLDVGEKVFRQDFTVHPSVKLFSKDESIPICKVMATKLEYSESAQ
ncbi:hypothetical protein Acr_05g0001510 [Actinidia rufa]|uniref:Large ribosomal subunit protein bL25 beta domain-containing protein n=1 Tax=Actinidia rufa TaxID=165716 RepID=A0A7J0EJP9_9ERIC|nr:hypothetical protein Acr_05g0001510 [Actinidia rufa]